MKILCFDIMLDGRYIKTMRLPVSSELYFIQNDGMADVICEEAIKEVIERRLPTLKGRKYNIVF